MRHIFLFFLAAIFLSCGSSNIDNTKKVKEDMDNQNIMVTYKSTYAGDDDIVKGGNFQLIGRLPLHRTSPVYTCKAEGRVVVQIKVDKSGKVIEAIPGVVGSTTQDKCLYNRSKEAALKTLWQKGNSNTPEIQVGKIIYNFSLR